ncbi:MAG: glutamate racemase [Cyanobacteriota bacterium]|nr:glutamate racemase [Cyanobacteriota bacterium]
MKEIQRKPIGVFDSGVGGLTVLRELCRQLPHESILYFGDTARLPYGTRTAEEILQFVREIIHWMAAQQVKMLIMACNTSSALALETVQREWDIPMLGLILPGARAAVQAGRRIGVIATPATAASNAYRRAILEVDASVRVWQVGCPEFVPLIEGNRIGDPYTRQVARQYLKPLIARDIDALVYGCTHYPHLETVLRPLLPASVRLVNPARSLVSAAEQELELMGLKNLDAESVVPTRFFVSGSPHQFSRLSHSWLGSAPAVEKVYLEAVSMT